MSPSTHAGLNNLNISSKSKMSSDFIVKSKFNISEMFLSKCKKNQIIAPIYYALKMKFYKLVVIRSVWIVFSVI